MKKPAIDFEHQLHTLPIRNTQAVVTDSERKPEAILVQVKLTYKGVLGPIAKWVNARRAKRYELAGLSREMFERVDGRTSVEQLVDWLCEQERLTFLEGRALVVHYLRDLMRRGLVVVVSEAS